MRTCLFCSKDFETLKKNRCICPDCYVKRQKMDKKYPDKERPSNEKRYLNISAVAEMVDNYLFRFTERKRACRVCKSPVTDSYYVCQDHKKYNIEDLQDFGYTDLTHYAR